jgi:hypothetical protein
MLAELLLLCAWLIAAALPLLAWLWRRSGRGARVALVLGSAALLASSLVLASAYQRAGARAAEPPSGRPIEVRGDGFTSSDACRACHPDQYASWRGSYHSTMTQKASPESVLAPFDGRVVEIGHRYRLERRGDAFVAVSDDPSWLTADVPEPKNERRIVLVSGFHHHQVYWYESGHGRQLGRLPFFYRIEERRFAPFHAVFLAQEIPTDYSAEAIWNSSCLRCHTTDPRPRFGDFTKMDTEVAEFGIACESCHGPGQDHVEQNRNPLRRYASHFGDDGDPSIVNPRRLSAARSSQACALCHSVHVFRDQQSAYEYSEHGPSFRPGDDIEQFWTIVRAGGPETPVVRANLARDPHWMADRFWPDGMVNVVGREYNAVEASPCFQGGDFGCLSCHDLHQHASDARARKDWANDQLGPGMRGDAACLQCHEALGENVEAHTHHAAESAGSRCQDCHMPHTTWGLLKAARSHQIDSPNAATTLSTGRMNACNLCHMDRTLAWTAQHLESWYGIAPPEIAAADQREVAEGVLHALRGDAGQRAIAAWNMGRAEVREASGSDWMLPVLAELLLDPYEGVRHAAFGSVRALPGHGEDRFDYLAPEPERRAARDALLARWQGEPRAAIAGDARRVLRHGDGDGLDRARLQALLSQRDDRRVFRGE